MSLRFNCLWMMLFSGMAGYSQTYTLQGKVVNRQLEPLSFASPSVGELI